MDSHARRPGERRVAGCPAPYNLVAAVASLCLVLLGAGGPALAQPIVSQLKAGGHHACALAASGSLWCWGSNQFGQLGNDSTVDSSLPVQVQALGGPVAAVTAGADHTCVLSTAGGVQCWGLNASGQLGFAGPNAALPVPVPGLASGVAAITAGELHTCALTTAGGVKCWGDNVFGQVGDGSAAATRPAPTDVAGLSGGVTALVSMESHTCAVLASGEARCWGLNNEGQLGGGTLAGNGNGGRMPTPVTVAGLGAPVAGIAVGRYHSCALVAGAVKCWGRNDRGQLGTGNTTSSLAPVDAVGLASGVEKIAAAWNTSCAIDTSGALRCWGENDVGQLGLGAPSSARPTPVLVPGFERETAEASLAFQHSCFLTRGGSARCTGINPDGRLGNGAALPGAARTIPLDVVGLTAGFASSRVAAGGGHSCAVRDGAALCWGRNLEGQLGDGTGADSEVPVGVAGLGTDVASVVVGGRHACALTIGGDVRCWGSNSDGQLGAPGPATSLVPLAVAGLSGIVALAAGDSHTCAIASGGTVKCWGDNSRGQLGSAAAPDSATPLDVAGLPGAATALTAGDFHTCALDGAGSARCWGWNEDGQLGNGTLAANGANGGIASPVQVQGLVGTLSGLSAGGRHTCAIAGTGVRCWGRGDRGQLGNGGTSGSLAPVAVTGFSGVAQVASGAAHSCAILHSGLAKCWGANERGQLGSGSAAAWSATAVDVAGFPIGTESISAGAAHTCARTTGGWTRCWGANDSGQAGDGTRADRSTPAEAVLQATQSIAFAPGSTLPYGGPTALDAAATSGLATTFDGWTPGTCSVSGASVTPLALGLCGVRAAQAGNGDVHRAPGQARLLRVVKGEQAIAFAAVPAKTFVDAPFAVTATGGGSGNPVTLAALTTAVCSLSGTTVTILSTGLCTVAANQAGNALFEAAPQATLDIPIARAAQAITFGEQPARSYAPGGSFAIGPLATASSGLAVAYGSLTPAVCSVSGTTVAIHGAGTCTLAADQDGDANFEAAPRALRDVAIARAAQAIAFGAQDAAPVFAPGATFPIAPLATASSGLPVVYDSVTPAACTVSGTTVSILGAGICGLAADQPGDANHEPAPRVFRAVTIARAPQAITFPAQSATPTFSPGGAFAIDPAASASSGLAVAYGSLSPTVCSVAGTTVSILTAGTCLIAADQPGDANYLAAPRVAQFVAIARAAQSLSFGAPASRAFDPAPVAIAPAAIASSGLAPVYASDTPATCAVSGTTVRAVAIGTCTLTASQPGDASYEPAAPVSRSFTISKADQAIDFPSPGTRVLGAAPFALVATAGAAPVAFESTTPAVCATGGANGATLTLLALGDCSVTARQPGDANYNAAADVTRTFSVVDGTPPETTLTAAPAGATNSTSASFEFTADEAAVFECSLDGAAFAACASPQAYAGLAEGPHLFAVRAIDTAGNVDPTPAQFAWTVDVTPPAIAITAGPGITAENQSAYAVSGTCSEAGRTVNVLLGSVAAVATCGVPTAGRFASVAADVSALPQGPVAITASLTDAAGNSATASHAATKDTLGPALTLDAPDAITQANRTAYRISGTCEAGGGAVSYTLALGAVVSGTAACDAGIFVTAARDVSALGEGTVALSVSQADAAGNTTTTSGGALKDTLNPLLVLDAPPPVNAANQSSYPVSGTCSENGRVVSVTVAGTVSASPDCAGGAFETGGLDLTALPDGQLAIVATQVDAVGNSASANASTAKDAIGPAAPVVASPSGTIGSVQPAVSGTAEPLSTVTVRIDGIVAGTATADAGGHWTLPLAAPLAPRGHVATAIATDASGNVSAASAPRSFFVAPVLSVIPATLPPGTVQAAYAQALSAAGEGLAPYAFAVAAGTLPPGLALRADGLLDGIPTTAGSYSFTIRVTDADGVNGPFTASRAFTLAIATVPGAPVLRSISPGNASATLSFDPPADDGGAPILSHVATCQPGAISKSAASSPITVTGLANGVVHTCSVRATNRAGTGPASAALSVVPSLQVVTLDATRLDFGGQSMGTTSAAQQVTVTNLTSAPLVVSGVSASGPFTVSHGCGTLAIGASCAISVRFAPPAAAGALNASTAHTGVLTIASGGPGSPHAVALEGVGEKSLVTHYYRSILRRAPDTAGKAFWQGEGARMGALGANVNETWFAMAMSFYSSAEYLALGRDDAGYVTDLYNTFFNRPPDAGGLAFWTGQMDGGMPREVVLASFMFSTEFGAFTRRIFGDTTVRAEVDTAGDFYRGLLSRLGDDGGFAFWVQRFRAAQCRGGDAVYAEVEAISDRFLGSAEYANRARTNRQFVGDLYNAFLRRGGDLAGVLFWIGQLDSGARTRSQLRQAFLASPEFNARVVAIVADGCLSP